MAPLREVSELGSSHIQQQGNDPVTVIHFEAEEINGFTLVLDI